jgi:UDP-N-acetylmuramoylalanine--D-glutamate ligase
MEKFTRSTLRFVKNTNSVEHQLETVAQINGVLYINDSGSSNIKSTVESINTINSDLILIIGGDDGATDYTLLVNAELKKVKAVVYLGKNVREILDLLSKYTDLFVSAHTLEEAIQQSKVYVKAGQVILFSPGCPPSENNKNRGKLFKEIVANQ